MPLTQDQWAEARRAAPRPAALSLRRDRRPPGRKSEHGAQSGYCREALVFAARHRQSSHRQRSPLQLPTRARLSVAASWSQQLYKAMDTELKLMERRMETQMTNLEKEADLTSADHERDTRVFGAMIKNIEQVKEMQADLDRVDRRAARNRRAPEVRGFPQRAALAQWHDRPNVRGRRSRQPPRAPNSRPPGLTSWPNGGHRSAPGTSCSSRCVWARCLVQSSPRRRGRSRCERRSCADATTVISHCARPRPMLPTWPRRSSPRCNAAMPTAHDRPPGA